MKTINAWVFTTQNCNLRCPYCWEEHKNINMSKEVWDSMNSHFINLINDNTIDAFTYRLSGGEPFINFDEWKEYPIHLKGMLGKKFNAGVISNLTIYNSEIRNYLIDNKIGIGVSLDGTQNSKIDINGNSTSATVMRNIDNLIIHKKFPNILTVLSKDNITDDEVVELATYIADRNLAWKFNFNTFGIDESLVGSMTRAVDLILQTLIKKRYDFAKLTIADMHLGRSCQGHCFAGINGCAIDVYGNIFPCQTVSDKEPIGNILTDSNIVSTLREQTTYKVGYQYEYPDVCKECKAFYHCRGGCQLHQHPSENTPSCKLIRNIYDLLIKYQGFPK